MTVLIVEDDYDEGHALAFALQRHTLPDGMPIQCAMVTTGRQARAWLAQQPTHSIKVIVLDRELACGEDSLALIAYIRQSSATWPHAPIIVRSGRDEPEMIGEARRSGADAFLSKRRITPAAFDLLNMLTQLWEADTTGRPRPWLVRR